MGNSLHARAHVKRQKRAIFVHIPRIRELSQRHRHRHLQSIHPRLSRPVSGKLCSWRELGGAYCTISICRMAMVSQPNALLTGIVWWRSNRDGKRCMRCGGECTRWSICQLPLRHTYSWDYITYSPANVTHSLPVITLNGVHSSGWAPFSCKILCSMLSTDIARNYREWRRHHPPYLRLDTCGRTVIKN